MERPYIVTAIVILLGQGLHRIQTATLATFISALSPEEARGKVQRQFMDSHPPTRGWMHFSPTVHELSAESLQKMLNIARPEDEIPAALRIEFTPQ